MKRNPERRADAPYFGVEASATRNRVSPTGELVATSLRGSWLGNRGILHEGTEIRRFHAGKLWITCVLTYKEQRLPQWAPGHFTVLFFHDEAVALAAGHRPCALCRRDSYNAYRAALVAGGGATNLPKASELDGLLHEQRLHRGTHQRRLHPMAWPSVPDGAYVLLDDGPGLVLDDAVAPWTPMGYGAARRRPRSADAALLTPPASLAAIRGGYAPQIDEAALRQA